ncbi:dynactin-like protein [Phyllosticta citricarpa]|uniref:Dynactin-like protein n=1 Tax=Phyllosticta citricarpa TaxID=55181 RepID=A0ABR1MLX1_9PEZI
MADEVDLKVGQVVELVNGRVATVRFIGETQFASDEWVGVEFDDASGKNDGSVQGERYFDCEPGHGMFLRRTGVSQVLEQPKPKAPAKPAAAAAGRAPAKSVSRRPGGSVDQGKSRPSSVVTESTNSRPRLGSRPTSIDTGRVAASGTRIGSPTKRPAAGSISQRARPSLGGATAASRRVSNVASSASKAAAPAAPKHTPRPSLGGPTRSGSARTSSTETPKPAARQSLVAAKRTPPHTGSSTPTSTPAAQRSTSSSQDKQQIQELTTKVAFLESKRNEDRERIVTLERVQEERDRFEQIIQKLQNKIQPLSQENAELKKHLKDAEGRLEQVETLQAEHESIMEMATLDREMAEEQTEAYKAELDAVKEKLEEIELENEILKGENDELSKDMSPEERTSQGWIQMERENERLREALIRLRDITQQSELEFRDQIKGLEEDVQELSGVKGLYEETKAALADAEADREELRQQLEAALGAEEMIEELTEKNLSQSEYIENLKATIEELETIKELNDELEINHVENEKQLLEQIDYKDAVITDFGRRALQQDETVADQEYTIMRFRELVTNLQSDMEDMRASREISETEAQELNSRSRAMMDLNKQLQQSASSTKVKTIDMELRKLEAQEAAEHLAIVQLFLPEAFHSERESVLALLRFKRIGFKASLIHNFVKDKVSGDAPVADEDIFEACDVLDKLTWVSAMCDRFVTAISTCSLDQFAKFEGALYELEPVERALNGYIEALKNDELKEKLVAEELHRSIAVMGHLAERHLGDTLVAYADDVLMRTLLMQSHLETSASALALVKLEVQSKVHETEENAYDGIQRFVEKTEAIIAQTRSTKVIVGKTLRALQEHKARSMTISGDTSPQFCECQDTAEELAMYTRALGENIFRLLHEEGRNTPFSTSEVRNVMFKTSESVWSVSESDLYTTFAAKLRQLVDVITELSNMTSDLEMIVEFEKTPAPWVLRSKELQDSKIVSIDAEEEIRRLKEEVHGRTMQIKLQEQRHEEATVKIELLESRTRDASKKAQRITELERKIDELRAKERELVEQHQQHVDALAAMETEKEKWKGEAEKAKALEAAMGGELGAQQRGGEKTVATKREIDALRTDIAYLEAANRYLRSTNRREHGGASGPKAAAAVKDSWLALPVVPGGRKPGGVLSSRETAVPKYRLALHELTNLPHVARPIDLKAVAADVESEGPRKRLAWRPMKATPQWQLSEQELRKADAWDALWRGDDFDDEVDQLSPWGGGGLGMTAAGAVGVVS